MRRVFASILLAGPAFLVGCGGSTTTSTASSSTTTSTSTSNGTNVMPIAVNGGPMANQANGFIYQDAAFASATICNPNNTSSCVTIGGLLVDTGSTGLRVFQSAVSSLGLPALNASNGSPAYDCISFVDNSYLWGPVDNASVTLGGEPAVNVPIQVISSSNTGIPSSCSNGSTLNENTVESLGANGILGIGLEPTDCYYEGDSACSPAGGLSSPPYPAYYTCSGSTCNPAFVSVANQVTNPVAALPTDNNGVLVELPSVSGSAASISGSVIFGIGTESNNQLSSSATVFTLACDAFTTVLDNQTYGITNTSTCAGPESFIDSGSNGLFFPNAPGLPTCPSNSSVGDLSSYYCPTSTTSFTATNKGENGDSKATSFSVANAESLFTNSATANDAALSNLAGANPSSVGFDWGLPFFFGVNVYSAIDGMPQPSGTPAAPWWAY